MRIVLEPIFEAQFFAHSYGFRPMRDAPMTLERAKMIVFNTGYYWIVEGDISKCFDRSMGAGVRDNHKVIRIADKVAWYQIAPFAQSMKSGFWSGIRCMGFLALPLTGNPFIHDIQG